ncbi:MAG TPA: HupE/UreJ family protein [Vicinamibacterales bacterium]|nr:HupE/UreJ family protein [Vicinamibacterales bacterium]
MLRTPSRTFAAIAIVAATLTAGGLVRAHDIPADVLVQAFVKPEGRTLRIVVRAPLRAMRDIEFPLRVTGNLDFGRADRTLRDAAVLWIANDLRVYEEGEQLPAPELVAVMASLPSDRSFGSYEQAVTHLNGPPLPAATEVYWDQVLLDAIFDYPIRSDRARFSIDPALARLGVRVTTSVRFLPPAGTERAFEFSGNPGLIRLDPRWRQAALSFVQLGFLHILDGTDHLLFLVCLVIPFRRIRSLVVIVTAFTVAHSITLIAAAYGVGPSALWFPPLIETLIAVSIVYMALENIVLGARGAPPPLAAASRLRARLQPQALLIPRHLSRSASSQPGQSALEANVRRRWMITLAFGLVHGFGFSFALRQSLQYAGSHLLTSLLSFNVGVELGQLLVLALFVPALHLLFKYVVTERTGGIILSAIVAHTAWHWMTERWQALKQFAPPAIDLATMTIAVRWLMGLVIAAGVIWLLMTLTRRNSTLGARESALGVGGRLKPDATGTRGPAEAGPRSRTADS